MHLSSVDPGTVDQPVTGRDLLLGVVRHRWSRLALAAALLSTHLGCEALVPVLIGVVVDEGVGGSLGSGSDGGLGATLGWIAALAVVFAGLALSYRHGRRRAAAIAEWGAHDLRMRLTRRLLDARGGAGAGHLPGALTDVATGDARTAGTIGATLVHGAAQIAGLTVATIAVAWIDPLLGLLVPLGAAGTLGLGHLLGRPVHSSTLAEQAETATAAGVAADLVAGLRVLNGIGAERAAVARYRGPSRRARRAAIAAARARGVYEGTALAATGVLLAVVALTAAQLAMAGRITIGELAAAIGLAQFLLGPLQMLVVLGAELARARASADRIAQVLCDPPIAWPTPGPGGEPASGSTLASPGLSLRGVSGAGLDRLDLEVAPGELVGIAAQDPADALALLRILTREIDPSGGQVLLDDTPLTALSADALRARILVAAHDAVLFGGPLLENVESRGGSAERTERVLAASAADEVIAGLPGGRASLLSERGGNLSGGQRQRLALARALNADPPVLVLHDPTTAVDSVTEARIATGIATVRRGRTTLLVATSPALLAATDRVVLVRAGRVVASGPHGDLSRQDTDYRATVLA